MVPTGIRPSIATRRMVDCAPVDSPAVSLLWEAGDAGQQLERRFGFRGAVEAAEWVGETLARRWDLHVTSCDRIVISSWNAMAWLVAGDRRLIAKWSAAPPRFARLRDAAQVTSWLEDHDLPVAAPITSTDGRLLVEFANEAKARLASRLPLPGSRFLLGVLPVVDGDLLDIDDAAHVVDAGRMLAAIHEALGAYPDRVGRGRPKGSEQLVHNDFRSANLLHDGTRITAVLDLEEVTYASRIADLAKAAVLLGTRYRDWRPTPEEVREAFVAAYLDRARTVLSPSQRKDFDAVVASLLRKGWWTGNSAATRDVQD